MIRAVWSQVKSRFMRTTGFLMGQGCCARFVAVSSWLPTAPPLPTAHPQASASSLSRPGREEALHKRQKGLQGENIQMKHLELPLSVVFSPTLSARPFLAGHCGGGWL